MQPFIGDVGTLAQQNQDFRRVLFTGLHSQTVAMMLPPGEEIGLERHEVDQAFLIVQGVATFNVDGRDYVVEANGLFIVPTGAQHNVLNTGDEDLRLITIYAPAQHADGTVHHTKADAMRGELLLHV